MTKINKDIISIAIDGPAGAGKSTISDLVSQHFNILHLDTGAMYRALAYYVLEQGIEAKDEKQIEQILLKLSIKVEFVAGKQLTKINEQDLTPYLRQEKVGKAASDISTLSCVRAFLVEQQQKIAAQQSLVMDGRDIGTVVLPDAKNKFYLTASPEIRAERRFLDLKKLGDDICFSEVLTEVNARDKQDMERTHSPLKQADNALLIDSSDLRPEEVVAIIVKHVEANL